MHRSKSIMLVIALSMLVSFMACSVWADSRKIITAIDEASQSCRGVSKQMGVQGTRPAGVQELGIAEG